MRRLMLDMSPIETRGRLGLTFQQVAAFSVQTSAPEDDLSPSYVADFLATSDGLSLVKAFVSIEDPKLRRAIVRLVEEIVPENGRKSRRGRAT